MLRFDYEQHSFYFKSPVSSEEKPLLITAAAGEMEARAGGREQGMKEWTAARFEEEENVLTVVVTS